MQMLLLLKWIGGMKMTVRKAQSHEIGGRNGEPIDSLL